MECPLVILNRQLPDFVSNLTDYTGMWSTKHDLAYFYDVQIFTKRGKFIAHWFLYHVSDPADWSFCQSSMENDQNDA